MSNETVSIMNMASPAQNPEKVPTQVEEFFEQNLFMDIADLKSLKQVCETAALDLNKMQDDAYQALFKLYQSARGINTKEQEERGEITAIYEWFFKNYYLTMRTGIDKLISNHSPLKIAYLLGKYSDKLVAPLEQILKEMEKEL